MLLLHQVQSPVVYLLGLAAGLALAFGERVEACAIGAVLAINTAIGFATEVRAARSIEALRTLGGRTARVRRDGRTVLIPAEALVPGDIVLVEAGDLIAADLRLLEASNLGADESLLTGESVPTDKSIEPTLADAPLGERRSMLFKGTAVTRGTALGVVVGTGLRTELGRISQLVAEAAPARSPLERRLAHLAGQLVWATVALTALLAAAGFATGQEPLLMAEAAIALAVAAIPEGLPVVATLALARGVWRMARQNALVERLSAVETLGATTVILTDKTGTLTENRMTVGEVWLPSEAAARELNRPTDTPGAAAELRALLTTAVLCNNATLGADPRQDSGDPMELALLRAGRSAGLDREGLLQDRPLLRTHAFDAATRMMATIHGSGRDRLMAVKGAPEAILASSVHEARATGDAAMSGEARKRWARRIEALGRQGLRVLACAIQNGTDREEGPFEGLTFQGLIGLEDPARADVPAAIGACRRAGIRVVMVTGDHAVTARSIGHAVGLDSARTVEGHHLKAGGDSDGALLRSDIFARVSPEQKLALVRAYQAAGETVAMTGDGVNDAPALRQADIGVAMGQRGTDVARQAAAMILLDDAFPTIVRAIREGRVIFGNIRRFAAFLLSCNLSEVLVVGGAVIGTLPLPILPLQILYLNLVTDVFPAFALAMGEGDREVMQRPPRPPREPILGRAQWTAIVLQSLALTAGTFASLFVARYCLELDEPSTVTVTFLTLAFAQLWHVFNMRHAESRPMVNEIVRSPWIWASLLLCAALLVVPAYLPALAAVLHLVPPSRDMWVVVLACSLAPLVVTQAAMLARRGSRRRAATTAVRGSAGHG